MRLALPPFVSMSMTCNFGPRCGVCTSENSEFRKAVFHVVAAIPAGTVFTYGTVAKAIGKPKASRAVGNALKANPFNNETSIPRVPCHRVVGKNHLGGFYGKQKIAKKVQLLQSEGVHVEEGKVDPSRVLHSLTDYKAG